MRKTIRAWAMFLSDGDISFINIRTTRKEIIHIANQYGVRNWNDMYSVGYRIRRITIIVED